MRYDFGDGVDRSSVAHVKVVEGDRRGEHVASLTPSESRTARYDGGSEEGGTGEASGRRKHERVLSMRVANQSKSLICAGNHGPVTAKTGQRHVIPR
jgi:hypothetical protein